jgi:NhaP-type Na+/H+ or K+/H+ antiporter
VRLAYPFYIFKLVPIVGFLIAGVVIGPNALALVPDQELVDILAEIGVILLLFTIGIEFSLDKLNRIRKAIFVGGGLQVFLTTAAVVGTAGALAVLAWHFLGLLPATAILLGAVVAPTDPVLASGVEAGAPLTELEEERDPTHRWGTVRFSLTSEAGFNDGLAFPLTNLAIAVAGASAVAGKSWLVDWFLVDVLYKILVGTVLGYAVGQLVSRLLFRLPGTEAIADVMVRGEEVMAGTEALATTLFAYSVTELLGGYGFIAVFVAALVLRNYEWQHSYYQKLHDFGVVAERLLMAAVLVLFGGTLAGGLLDPLTVMDAIIGLALILLIRPIAGLIGMAGATELWQERAIIASYGVRGPGSFYYLAHALNAASFQEFELVVATDQLWALLGFVVVASLAIHGITAAPVMNTIDQWRSENKEDFSIPEEAD